MNSKPGITEQSFDQRNNDKFTFLKSYDEYEEEKQKINSYLQIKFKFNEKVEFFKNKNGNFIGKFQYNLTLKDEYIENTKYIYKIVIYDKDLFPLYANNINGGLHCICEIEEKQQNYLLFSQNNYLYSLLKYTYNPNIILDMKIYLICQVNTNIYIISNDIGTYLYKGSIFEETRKNLENSKIIGEGKIKLGIKINSIIVALVTKDYLKIVNLIKEEQNIVYGKDKIYDEFCENCYNLFISKNNTNILLLVCQKNEKNGVLIIEFKNESCFEPLFFEIEDFEIQCFMRIEKLYEESTIKAFSENYDKEYFYFLFGGKNKDKSIIKLVKISKDGKSMDVVKDIWTNKYSSRFNSINQYQSNFLLINFGGEETIMVDIINKNNSEQNTIELLEYQSKEKSYTEDEEQNSYQNIKSKIVQTESTDNLIKFTKPLNNDDYFIGQDNKIFVIDNSFSYKYIKPLEHNYFLYCICPKSEDEIFVCRSNGLYKINLKEKKKLYKINDMIYYLILKIKDNDYIISLNEGTFRIKKDISLICKEDLKEEICISKKAFKIGKLIQKNNKSIVILMLNINNNEGYLIIIDIDNNINYYILIKNRYPYNLSENSIILFQTKENPNNYIFLCSTEKLKDFHKNGILALNINLDNLSNKAILELFYDTYDFRINSMILYERGNNDFEKYFLIGGSSDSYDFEIRLMKIKYSDDKRDCLFLDTIKNVFNIKDIQNYFSYSLQPICKGHLLTSSNKEFYLYKIETEVEKKENQGDLLYNLLGN